MVNKMNADNPQLEKISTLFNKEFSYLFSQGYTEITHTLINQKEGYISTLPSNYQWHLTYWQNDLDLKLSERCREGMHSWTEYSHPHKKSLCKIGKNITKIDICTKTNDGYELFSVSQTQSNDLSQIVNAFKLKAAVSHYAARMQNLQYDKTRLPLRQKLSPIYIDKITLPEYPHFFFNGINFTPTEMNTIRLLLELKTIKEIATYHYCTLTAEKRRIEHIKQKLSCENQPLSKLFSVLRKRGVTAACLESYITYQ
jgi:DNA-binding CsgD family transcriptional regulator